MIRAPSPAASFASAGLLLLPAVAVLAGRSLMKATRRTSAPGFQTPDFDQDRGLPPLLPESLATILGEVHTAGHSGETYRSRVAPRLERWRQRHAPGNHPVPAPPVLSGRGIGRWLLDRRRGVPAREILRLLRTPWRP